MRRPRRPRRAQALLWAERLAAVGQVTDAVEQLAARRDRRRGGLLDAAILADDAGAWPAGTGGRLMRAAAAPGPAAVLQGLRVAAGATLLARSGPRARLAADAVLAVAGVLTRPQLGRAANGADQMAFVVGSATAVARLARSPRVTDAALWCVALNSALGYTASGLLKASSPAWRDGRAVTGIMRTAGSGDPRVAALLRAHPSAARLLGPAVAVLEASFALAFLRGGRLAPALVAGAAGMHLANAATMGLHQFLWTFGATYPPLLYVSGPRRGDGQVRDDLLPAVAGLVLAGTACAGLLGTVAHRDRRTAATDGGPAPVARGPLVLLVRSPLAPPARWHNVVDRLPAHLEVVHDAGLGTDRVLARVAARGAHRTAPRDVVLVGHGAGGLVALRVAQDLTRRAAGAVRVRSVVWVDAGSVAAGGQVARARERILRRVARCLRLGMAPLMQAPAWTDDLDPASRARATAALRRPATWTEAADLWRDAATEIGAGPAWARRAGGVPVVVIDPHEGGAATDHVVAQLAAGEPHRVPSVDGDTVLTAAAGAEAVATAVLRSVGDRGAPDGRTPEDRAPDDRAPEDRAPEDRAPEDKAPEDKAPDDRARHATA